MSNLFRQVHFGAYETSNDTGNDQQRGAGEIKMAKNQSILVNRLHSSHNEFDKKNFAPHHKFRKYLLKRNFTEFKQPKKQENNHLFVKEIHLSYYCNSCTSYRCEILLRYSRHVQILFYGFANSLHHKILQLLLICRIHYFTKIKGNTSPFIVQKSMQKYEKQRNLIHILAKCCTFLSFCWNKSKCIEINLAYNI
ncbi:hypothetical protein EGR_10812 [Echinococcus granulosus]|uniref:Uncharacterized protein n=1 Tax=Echinococcus granulosus TaxID=6210 RepID=W6ULC5_ECHGR|nr:hypothetical protein EGR_10812 [Echinococcus granulosus]EUB54324.1 hypothetical protein EGR_10812 [Echinococcus granulosus]